ncbi:MAG: type I restriction endonuclease subunit R [Gammaproteobacteria bacterium]|nr:type I restriction endonuclease subunit R [Gammaproteobacteria bacterium]
MKEHDIEQALIDKLVELKYQYREDIRNRAALKQNFRSKFQSLNNVLLTDAEFNRLYEEIVTNDVFIAAKTLRERHTFIREDATPLDYTLVNIDDWCKNDFEVINQLRINTDSSHHRYDVILLINGIPVVQIELKSLEISPRCAIKQIVEYKNDTGNGYSNTLLCFMQLFIVSNVTNTYYFANNTQKHFQFNAEERFLPIYHLADKDNRKISHLDGFADQFLAKCTLGQMISRYMVLVESEQKLMIMRPYQIYAVKAIIDCIEQNRGNGYIWHTTGSGKTLTSFKAATLLKDNSDIDKCLFVVDRKDLDRQTRQEFNKFQAGCVEENTNTETLVSRLLSSDYADKVIVTTIQKLGLALDENNRRSKIHQQQGKPTYKQRLSPLGNKRMVFIFDECHRSQFGANHQAIKDFFPNAQLFGFTGTPIFEDNATYKQVDGTQASSKTTRDIFQQQLHAYTITHAIDDGNVLRFRIDYFGSRVKNETGDDNKHRLSAHSAVVDEIIQKHDAATNNRRFNAILATSSINSAIEYYHLFKAKQASIQANDASCRPLNIACVFSPPAEGNKDVSQIQEDLPQEKVDNKQNPAQKKQALKAIIHDYNQQYDGNHDMYEFDRYYQDVQKRIKDHQYNNKDYPHQNKIDITIVVDMLLTGFDSKYLNTLYVDKNLKHHSLIQAFSRTNRVLNDTKPYGNILDFRYQEQEVDAAIALFSAQKTTQAKAIWLVDPAPVVINKLDAAANELKTFMDAQGLSCTPEAVSNLKGDAARGGFINHFKEVQRLKTQLDQYTDLSNEQVDTIQALLPKETLLGFRSMYLELAQRLQDRASQGCEATDEPMQLDLELVLFSSSIIDYDYIMRLVAKSTGEQPDKQKMSRQQLVEQIKSSSNHMDERQDIIHYIDSLPTGKVMDEKAVRDGYETFKSDKSQQALASLAVKHQLKADALQCFVDKVIERMVFDGEQLTDLMEPLGLGWQQRAQAELALMADLKPQLQKLAQGREISGLAAYE